RAFGADRAEDLLQQTFLQIHRGRASFLPGSEVTAWAFTIARRLMIDGLRKDVRQVPLASPEEAERSVPSSREPHAEDRVGAHQLARRVEQELARLPDAQRAAFELVKQDGLSIAEAAQVLGCTPNAVKIRAHRAYEALRAIFGAAYEKE